MFLDSLKQIYLDNRHQPPLFLRSLLKETVQLYVLNFIFNSVWGSGLIMKGGTCLRFCFGLSRLSEDLDFDTEKTDFSLKQFTQDLRDYFVKTLKFDQLEIKTAKNQRTIYLKFPILKQIGLAVNPAESNLLHVRIDLSVAPKTKFKTEISLKSTADFSFIIRRYSLPDLFAGKIGAILTRETIEGKIRQARFKGRDYYDLIWFLEKEVKPNWEFVRAATGLDRIAAKKKLNQKIKQVSSRFLKEDLLPFFADRKFIENFAENFAALAKEKLKQLK